MKLENQNIVIVSNEPWGDTWYSKHNYAWELAKKNNIIFINPPSPFKYLNYFKRNIDIKKINKSLTVLTYKNILPVRIEVLRLLNENIIFSKLNRFFKKNKFTDIIFWTFDPLRLSTPSLLHPKLSILHMVDKYEFFKEAESIIPKNADIIFCVAQDIADNYVRFNKKTIVIPHAIPSDEFLPATPKSNKKISGIYVGNIDKRMDYLLTESIIKFFPNIDFQFVGNKLNNTTGHDKLFALNLPNVFYLGEKPYKELKYLIRDADFCFVFKNNNENGNNISSHKMLQYFAQGKPIFCSSMLQYVNDSHLLYMEDDKNKMIKLIESFILNGESAHIINKRIAYAQQHSFEITLNTIESHL